MAHRLPLRERREFVAELNSNAHRVEATAGELFERTVARPPGGDESGKQYERRVGQSGRAG
jgi:hypothetical protein